MTPNEKTQILQFISALKPGLTIDELLAEANKVVDWINNDKKPPATPDPLT